MILYGANPVLEAIRSHPRRVRWVAVAREQSGRMQKLVAEANGAGVAVRVLPLQQVNRLAGRGVHNGVVAEVSAEEYADFDEAISSDLTSFVLILDGVTDPQNFGAILRVADAFGVHLVVVPEHDSAGLTPAAVKASAGASEWIPLAQVTNLARAIEALKERDFWVYGAAADGDAADTIDLAGRVAIVLGSEGKGIRRNVLEHCDRSVSIPMRGHVDSLNVASAAAVLCYEVLRQTRPAEGSRGNPKPLPGQ